MSDPLVSLERRDGLAIVTFNNPPRGYLTQAQVGELAQHLNEVETDDAIRAVIFTGGVPGVFIRHYDVSEIQSVTGAVKKSGLDAAGLMEAGKRGNAISQLFDRVDQLSKPTIAAINGYCQGGGFEFALCCDIRLAEQGDYRIGLPETNIGIFPGAGGTQRLPRVIGEARALELILRGRTVGPAEAAELGLVHHLSTGPVLDLALEIVKDFISKPARALRDAKALVKSATITRLAEGCAKERGLFSALLLEDEEAADLMAKFIATGEDINT
jgi:enoyl-CoA hydratase